MQWSSWWLAGADPEILKRRDVFHFFLLLIFFLTLPLHPWLEFLVWKGVGGLEPPYHRISPPAPTLHSPLVARVPLIVSLLRNAKDVAKRAQANITRNVVGVEPDADAVHGVTPCVDLPNSCEGHTEQLHGACD